MDTTLLQYMVDFTLPSQPDDEFVSQIPRQRAMVNRLMSQGKILNYALSLENAKLWVIFSAPSEDELHTMIDSLPLSMYMKIRISPITFHNSAQTFVPAFSVN